MRQTLLTIVVGALLLGLELLLVELFGDDDLFAVDVFLVLFAPVVVLVLFRLSPMLHWIALAVIVAVTGALIVTIEQSDSSTAGFGLVTGPLLLSVAVLLAAAVDRLMVVPKSTSGSPRRFLRRPR